METTTIETEKPSKPQLLTVLCILTFIGVGLGIVGSLGGWWFANYFSPLKDQSSEMFEKMQEMNSPEDMENMMNKLKYINEFTVAGIFGCLICLAGALQMWKQKKAGFYIYLIGQITPLIVTVALMGVSSSFKGWDLLGLILPGTFIVLYSLNFKHLS